MSKWFKNMRKECMLHFFQCPDIDVFLSVNLDNTARIMFFVGACTDAMTTKEYPKWELIKFLDTYFAGRYRICISTNAQRDELKTLTGNGKYSKEITVDFLKQNFPDYNPATLHFALDHPMLDIVRRECMGGCWQVTVYYGDRIENSLYCKNIGEFITFLNLCGLNKDVVSKLKF